MDQLAEMIIWFLTDLVHLILLRFQLSLPRLFSMIPQQLANS